MEQKKILWIIAAVGVFLLVVLGAALVIYSPASRKTETLTEYTPKDATENGWITLSPNTNIAERTGMGEGNNSEYQQGTQNGNVGNSTNDSLGNMESVAGDLPKNTLSQSSITGDLSENQKVGKVQELTVYADNAKIYSNGAGDVYERTEGLDGTNPTRPLRPRFNYDGDLSRAESVATINITSDSASSYEVAEETNKRDEKTPPPGPVVAKRDVEVASLPPAPLPARKVAPPPASPARKPAPKVALSSAKASVNVNVKKSPVAKTAPAPTPKKTQYWVQVTSLTSKKSADKAREVLGDNKIPADIFTYTDKNGTLFYRVRVGPYLTKSEAEYWRGKISLIETFKNTASYIANTEVAMK